jgi:cobalamin biosynthesis protein CobD/CbiB
MNSNFKRVEETTFARIIVLAKNLISILVGKLQRRIPHPVEFVLKQIEQIAQPTQNQQKTKKRSRAHGVELFEEAFLF